MRVADGPPSASAARPGGRGVPGLGVRGWRLPDAKAIARAEPRAAPFGLAFTSFSFEQVTMDRNGPCKSRWLGDFVDREDCILAHVSWRLRRVFQGILPR